MSSLKDLLAERIVAGLKRKSIVKTSDWAQEYRIMGPPFPGPCRFDHHPWTKEMTDCEAEHLVGQKSAQMGFTEIAMNKVFKKIDIDATSVLYVLPASTPDASDFSTSRFDPALESSPYLNNLFTDVKNIGHKRAGNANLFIRGSRSRSQLKSVPVGFIVLDEKDEMKQDNIALVYERVSGQIDWQIFELSTPTITNHGINVTFSNSSQHHFFFQCPCCGKWTELMFPDCLVITAEDHLDDSIRDSHLICKECKGILNHDAKIDWLKGAIWQPTYNTRLIQGYYINQLYSLTVKPWQLATSYLQGLINPADEQEFFNSKLGLPHEQEGAKITSDNIEACRGDYKKVDGARATFTTMGVDVGKWIHYEIDEWFFIKNIPTTDINIATECKILTEGRVATFEELDLLMYAYNINYCVVDAEPETRKALEFAQRFHGIIMLCKFVRGLSGKNVTVNATELKVQVNRTSWMDLGLGRFKTKKISIPIDVRKEYEEHLKTPVRIIKKDADGNPVARYISPQNKPDHLALARTYSEIALSLGAGVLGSQNISREA